MEHFSLRSYPPYPDGEPGFIGKLREYHIPAVHWKKDAAGEGLPLLKGVFLQNNFPDPDRVLESVEAAWRRFAGKAGIEGEAIKLLLKENPLLKREAWRRSVSDGEIVVEAADSEGIRRAVYMFIDDCAALSEPFFPFGTVEKTPWLRNRISRCFFGPIKRPPFNHDELLDDVDYYPDAYLDRLASEGVNGLWLTGAWRELAHTDFFPDDPKREQRLEKLRKTVVKCLKYGIKIWLFCIDPRAWGTDNEYPDELADAVARERLVGLYGFCPAGKNAERYLFQAPNSIFREVPGLGGMMMISLGERFTTCLTQALHRNRGLPCADKCGLNEAQVLSKTLSPIRDGIRAAAPDAELLSWLYIPHMSGIPPWVCELPSELNGDGISMAFNFESGCVKNQLGKNVIGGDYWLSCAGPSDRFRIFAANAKGHCEFAAKLQVGCSHECATIPFMPVPAQLYRKYREMYKLGVGSVIQCWYFGNYPGTMNKAAGLLAYEDFKDDEQSFLTRLAAPEWGAADAPEVAGAWMKFSEAFRNYPMDIQFQYYGPMHDGPMWPLYLRRSKSRLTRSWKPEKFPAGDALCEMSMVFSTAELMTLSSKMSKEWHDGVKILRQLAERHKNILARAEDFSLCEALDILFASGSRILKFYTLREQWLASPLENVKLLKLMADLVEAEITASMLLAELCEADLRLGYHSEAEVFKFHPAGLRHRADELRRLLETDFKMVQESPDDPYWQGDDFVTADEKGNGYAETFKVNIEWDDEKDVLRVRLFDIEKISGAANDSFAFSLTDGKMKQYPMLSSVVTATAEIGYGEIENAYVEDDELYVEIPLAGRGIDGSVLFSCARSVTAADVPPLEDCWPAVEKKIDLRLNLWNFYPEHLALIKRNK